MLFDYQEQRGILLGVTPSYLLLQFLPSDSLKYSVYIYHGKSVRYLLYILQYSDYILAMAGVAQRLARQAHEEQAAVAAAEQEAAEAAEERRCEERAQALRDEMFAEDDLHMQLLQLPTTPAPRPQQAAAKPRRAAVAPVRMATVRSVAEQELEAEGL